MKRTPEKAKEFLRELFADRFDGDAAGATDRPAAMCDSGSTVALHRPSAPFVFASAPGRVELAGNHTDHQGGRTIAAAIDQRAYALAAPNGTEEIRVFMDGFGEARLSLHDLGARPGERGTSISLVRGMAAACARTGGAPFGFDMVTCSDVPVGSGVSSSAAFEMLLGAAIHALCDPSGETEPCRPTALAMQGVWAERDYFGKPCGAQDQLASAHGGIVAMDFSRSEPSISPIDFDADACGYTLCLVDSRHDHSLCVEEYAAIPDDMRAVARFFNRTMLEEVPFRDFLDTFPLVRKALGDRAVLRALHYFEETRRVQVQEQALRTGDFEDFLVQARLSGASSAQYLQNVSPLSDGSRASQPAMVILALCSHLLGSKGAFRIHGGGFGGSVLAFVPESEASSFIASMDALLGYDACTPVFISSLGAQAEWTA